MQIFHENFAERVVIVLNSPKGHKVTQRPSIWVGYVGLDSKKSNFNNKSVE